MATAGNVSGVANNVVEGPEVETADAETPTVAAHRSRSRNRSRRRNRNSDLTVHFHMHNASEMIDELREVQRQLQTLTATQSQIQRLVDHGLNELVQTIRESFSTIHRSMWHVGTSGGAQHRPPGSRPVGPPPATPSLATPAVGHTMNPSVGHVGTSVGAQQHPPQSRPLSSVPLCPPPATAVVAGPPPATLPPPQMVADGEADGSAS